MDNDNERNLRVNRTNFLRTAALVALVLFPQLLLSNPVPGQKRKQGVVAGCKEGVKSDWRFEQLVDRNSSKQVDFGDGFAASRNCNTVDVTIPGTYSDSLSGSLARPLRFQLAAAVFVKVCNASARDPQDAMENYFLKSKDVRQGSGDIMTEYFFRLKNGRVAHIFTYYNDLFGLISIIKTSPADSKK